MVRIPATCWRWRKDFQLRPWKSFHFWNICDSHRTHQSKCRQTGSHGSRFRFVRAKVVAPNFVKCPHRKRNLKTSAPSNLFKVSHLASPHSSTAFDRTCFFSWADIFGFGKPQKYSDPYRLRWYRKDRGTSSTMLKCVICSNKEVLAVSRTHGLKDIVQVNIDNLNHIIHAQEMYPNCGDGEWIVPPP